MNAKNTTNIFLNEKINNFKKKYTELLMELDNSSILNISKFENLEDYQRTDNISSLLKENEQVSKNLQLIKESIKKKILNLQLLSTKTGDSDLVDTYQNLYDFNVLDENRDYFQTIFSKLQIKKTLSDIDLAISKVEEMSNFIENKVIPKLKDDEIEKSDLRNLLTDSQKKIEQLLLEKDIDQQTIANLHTVKKEFEDEYNKLVDLWVELNQKLINLEFLIDKNERLNKEISEEKNDLIGQLEKKINELLKDLDSPKEIGFNDSANDLKITEEFFNLLSRVISEFFKFVYETENLYQIKLKKFNKEKDLLIKSFDDSKLRNDNNHLLIWNLSQKDNIDIDKEEAIVDINKLNEITSINDLQKFLDVNYVEYFDRIEKLLSDSINELNSSLLSYKNLFSPKIAKKISSFITQLTGYIEKCKIFKNQIFSLKKTLETYLNQVNFEMININNYWADVAYGIKQIYSRLLNDFALFQKIIEVFVLYVSTNNKSNSKILEELFPNQTLNSCQTLDDLKFNEIFEEAKKENDEKQQISFEFETKVKNDDNKEYDLISNLINSEKNLLVEYSSDFEINNVEEPTAINSTNNITISSSVDQLNNFENNYSNEFDSVFSEINNLKKDSLILEKNKNFESVINEMESQREFYNQKNDGIDAFSNLIENAEELDKDLTFLSEQNLISEYKDNFKLEQQILDFSSFAKKIIRELEFKTDIEKAKKIIVKKDLYKIFTNEMTTVKEKLEKIETVLLETFGESYYSQSFHYWVIVFKRYLLEKKYNINLKLRIAKSKLSKIKILVELERDRNYLFLLSENNYYQGG